MNRHRRKPFSAKQKKNQLQEKRARKRDQGNSDDEPERDHANNEHQSVEELEKKLSTQPKSSRSKEPTSSRLRSVFEKMTPAQIKINKELSMQPLVRLPKEALEVSLEETYPKILDFPKRPSWSYQMSKNALETREKEYFEEWLEKIYSEFPVDQLSFFEHNLEVWRQLWRVVEISDIILIVVDSRHPILHFPPALYRYVVDELKRSLVLVFNKVDLINEVTLDAWKEYFQQKFPDLHVASFSSYKREEDLDDVNQKVKKRKAVKRKFRALGIKDVLKACRTVSITKKNIEINWDEIIRQYDEETLDENEDENDESTESDEDTDEEIERLAENTDNVTISEQETAPNSDYITLGLIGHPNVGKSTLINGIMGRTVVSTSRTPGHTKHFQTIHLTKNIRLCDCPGLVFPSLLPKPLQARGILSGMYSIAQVQEPYTAIQYLAERIPIEYILSLKHPDDEESEWSAWEMCEAFALQRGFLTSRAARPDVYRAANTLLRFANDGRLILSFKPPGFFSSERYKMAQSQSSKDSGQIQPGSRHDESGNTDDDEDDDNDDAMESPKYRVGGLFGLLGQIDENE
ncbi:P-loop containing nucleoside triphosphate hydrolase protein [Basidiobolus meristosporus CBS 931.73]|uniref:Guanine nucleotide-binding protein-like 1 n=1 Tax=Basidiobolus meristosporus CBS 931.73 TaxID=1314790 RepID=A0A1Y1XTY6_9FUNG|nr:P-loop containing nucleoside triphosphate hydrolase protein [Basidiobolus meristosporus CBS 931.73]|eukprot:ORX89210.1 P-loop containing nucleoside triphosphate hydrolase protein [Basidiobolus meristosporus CBS 931.73]